MSASGSAKTVVASSKVIPCLRRFVRAFVGSHEKRTGREYYTNDSPGARTDRTPVDPGMIVLDVLHPIAMLMRKILGWLLGNRCCDTRTVAADRSFVAVAAAALLLLSLTASMWLDQLVFFPDRDVPPPPPGVHERWLVATDGVRLHAWYAAPPVPIATLVWSHGNGGNIAGRVDVQSALVEAGLAVLAYDYRGYGRSEGNPSEVGVSLDALAAYDAVRADGVPPERVIAFGESLGGAVAIRLAIERPCAGVAVVSPFTRLADVARVHYGALGAMAGGRFDSLARIGRLTVPLFVAHGDQDEIVPYELGTALYDAAPGPKRFFRAAGWHHNDVFAAPGLIEAIADFAREVAGAA